VRVKVRVKVRVRVRVRVRANLDSALVARRCDLDADARAHAHLGHGLHDRLAVAGSKVSKHVARAQPQALCERPKARRRDLTVGKRQVLSTSLAHP